MTAFSTTVYVIVTVAGSLAMLGSLLIILTYLLFKAHRTWSRRMVAWLAVADFGQGLFFCTQFLDKYCEYHAYLGIFFATSSFLWTTCIAFFVYCFFKRQALAKEFNYNTMLKCFHVICWGYPTIFLILLVIYDRHVEAIEYANSGDLPWCFIAPTTPSQKAWRMFAIYIPLYVSWVLTIVFYYLARRRVVEASAKNPHASAARLELQEVSRKLQLIPLIFVLLRVWGASYRLLEFFASDDLMRSFRWLAILTAMGDPSQGIANALVFVVFTKKIRASYTSACCLVCLRCWPSRRTENLALPTTTPETHGRHVDLSQHSVPLLGDTETPNLSRPNSDEKTPLTQKQGFETEVNSNAACWPFACCTCCVPLPPTPTPLLNGSNSFHLSSPPPPTSTSSSSNSAQLSTSFSSSSSGAGSFSMAFE